MSISEDSTLTHGITGDMVSLWGSKYGEETHSGTATPRETEPSEAGTSSRQTHRREPDERTRLIPRNEYGRFLHPDDPAVSFWKTWRRIFSQLMA